jgi:hypothetical protein
MNEQLQKSLGEILALLTESAKQIGTTAQQEVPLLVQEYLRWGLWSAASFAGVALLLLGAVWIFTARLTRASERMDDTNRDWMSGRTDRGDAILAVFWVRLAACVVFGGIALQNGYVALQIIVAPRVYLLEQLMGMVNR